MIERFSFPKGNEQASGQSDVARKPGKSVLGHKLSNIVSAATMAIAATTLSQEAQATPPAWVSSTTINGLDGAPVFARPSGSNQYEVFTVKKDKHTGYDEDSVYTTTI